MRTIAEEFDGFRIACFPDADGARRKDLEEAFFGGVASTLSLVGDCPAALPNGWPEELAAYERRRTAELEREALRNT